eukprot:3680757-Amphidinium_carterae.4
MASKMVQNKEAVAKALQTKREKKAAAQKAQATVDGGEAAVDQIIVGSANKVATMLVKTPSLSLKVHAMLEEGPGCAGDEEVSTELHKFSKLPDYVLEELMAALNPQIGKEWSKEADGDVKAIICFALHVLPSTWLPNHYSAGWINQEFILAAKIPRPKKRYVAMGERLKEGRPPSTKLWSLDYEKASR